MTASEPTVVAPGKGGASDRHSTASPHNSFTTCWLLEPAPRGHSFAMKAIPVSLAISCVLALSPMRSTFGAEPAEEGELRIYPQPTQIGTAACRTVSDAEGRPLKETYYRNGHSENAGKLVPYEIRVYRYVEGKQVSVSTLSPDQALLSSTETLPEQGGERRTVTRDGQGTIFSRQYGSTRVGYDSTGTKVILINGKIPEGVDLAAGWGPEVDGLACGVGVNVTRGTLAQITIDVTVRNGSPADRYVITSTTQEMQVELWDTAGRLVPLDLDRIRRQDEKLIAASNGKREARQMVRPSEARVYRAPEPLAKWYSSVPAGTYQLIVRRRADGADFPLVSKPVTLEILD